MVSSDINHSSKWEPGIWSLLHPAIVACKQPQTTSAKQCPGHMCDSGRMFYIMVALCALCALYMYSYVQTCSALCTRTIQELCTAMYSYVHLCTAMCSYVYSLAELFAPTYKNQELCTALLHNALISPHTAQATSANNGSRHSFTSCRTEAHGCHVWHVHSMPKHKWLAHDKESSCTLDHSDDRMSASDDICEHRRCARLRQCAACLAKFYACRKLILNRSKFICGYDKEIYRYDRSVGIEKDRKIDR